MGKTDHPKTCRAALIGLGLIGAGDPVAAKRVGQKASDQEAIHAQILAAEPQVQIVAGADLDEGARQRFQEAYGVPKTYADWREMLKVEKPDIVNITTNSPYHAELTIGCAEAGVRAVICEKPIATRLADADRAIRVCRERGTILLVHHQRRWHPLWRAVRDEIRNGTIGDVQHAMAHWSSARLGNVGTHWFDGLRMILGAEPTAVSATLDPIVEPDCRGPKYRDPGGWGVVSFSNGAKVFIDAPHASKFPVIIRAVGNLGQITLRGEEAVVELWSGQTRTISSPKDRPRLLSVALKELVNCLSSGGQPASTGADGLAALEIIIGFHVSDRLHAQWVPLPIQGADRELEVKIG